MKKLMRVIPLFVLLATFALAGIAATPAVLTQPVAPNIQATANGGELEITWDRVPGAQFYTVGWINWTEGKPVLDAGGDWLSLFHYTTVAGHRTSYTVKGQIGGDNHYAIIRATDVSGTSGRFGGGYSTWSSWSSRPAQPAGQHGEGFCPITGLPLPPGGYLSVGQTQTWRDATFRLDNATTPPTITDSGFTYSPAEGNKYLKLCGTWDNRTGSDMYFFAGFDYNLSTDTGIGFVSIFGDGWLDASPIPNGVTKSACDVWVIPDSATEAVMAIYDGNSPNNAVLYRVDLPARATSATLAPTSNTPLSGDELTRHIKPALGQIVATNSRGETSGGTGFIVGNNGIMVTNRHVVDDAQTVEVRMNTLDGRTERLTGTVLGRGILADLAAVQLPSSRTYSALPLADSDEVSGLDEVTAWGYPSGSISDSYPTITRGIISSKGIYGDLKFLQTDAAINPGNSGGPLVDQYGNVVGVNTLKSVGEAIDNQGFSMASNEVRNRLTSLIAGGPNSATYRNLSYNYGYSVDIPRGWFLIRENDFCTSFYNYHRKGNAALCTYDISDSFSGSNDKLSAFAQWKWEDVAQTIQEGGEFFQPISFDTTTVANKSAYRLEYRYQSAPEFCISHRIMLVVLSSSAPSDTGFTLRGSVCENNRNQYDGERQRMLNSFRP